MDRFSRWQSLIHFTRNSVGSERKLLIALFLTVHLCKPLRMSHMTLLCPVQQQHFLKRCCGRLLQTLPQYFLFCSADSLIALAKLFEHSNIFFAHTLNIRYLPIILMIRISAYRYFFFFFHYQNLIPCKTL